MSNKIVNGDYVLSGDTLEQVGYIDELLQDIRIILTASRGCFYPDKNFGSRIKTADGRQSAAYALLYARQALYDLDGVYVKRADLLNNSVCFTLDINGEERQVTLELESNI